MTRRTPLAALALSLALPTILPIGCRSGGAGSVPQTERPALVVLLVVDQMRPEYLERFGPQLEGGFARLLADGVVFTDAHQDHAVTATACGHTVLSTGRYPRETAIVDNRWPERATGVVRPAVGDDCCATLAVDGSGAPTRLAAPTIGDWMDRSGHRGRTVSVAGKDRAAILMGGHAPRHVYWYSSRTGGFTTSRYYRDALPSWVEAANRRLSADRFAGATWSTLLAADEYAASRRDDWPGEAGRGGMGIAFPHTLPTAIPEVREAVVGTPWWDEMILGLAAEAVRSLELGRGPEPDLLMVGLSATDKIGHAWGPHSVEIHDQILRLDRMLEGFLDLLDREVGLDRTVVVLTADHGVAPIPAWVTEQGGDAGVLDLAPTAAAIEADLDRRLGAGEWVLGLRRSVLYLDHRAISEAGGDLAEIRRDAAAAIAAVPKVEAVWTADELARAPEPGAVIPRRVWRAFHREEGGDVYAVLAPNWRSPSVLPADHGTPWPYDTRVPLVVAGPGIGSGARGERVEAVDVAPTVADLLGVRPPAGIAGQPLPLTRDDRGNSTAATTAAAAPTPNAAP